ncbi:MAG: aldehyde dehydrogenase family protein, partial [Sphingobium sp.]
MLVERRMQEFQMYVGGEWLDAASGETIETINPYTTQPWATIPRGTAADADRAVTAARAALKAPSWTRLTASARGALLRKLAGLMERDAEKLAQVESRDNGKLIAEIRGVLRYVPQIYYYYAGLADKIQGAVLPVDRPGFHAFTRHEPIGVVVAITPWNSPLLIAAAKCAPALAAGCTVILKPSESTSASALELAKLFEEAGFPPGVFNVVTGYGNEVGAALVEDKRVAAITFTGGDAGGRRINEMAASDFKHVSLELGGKSPNIIFEDADLEQAARGAVAGIFTSTGQTCIAGSRLL